MDIIENRVYNLLNIGEARGDVWRQQTCLFKLTLATLEEDLQKPIGLGTQDFQEILALEEVSSHVASAPCRPPAIPGQLSLARASSAEVLCS